jgi:hypothetical protein
MQTLHAGSARLPARRRIRKSRNTSTIKGTRRLAVAVSSAIPPVTSPIG